MEIYELIIYGLVFIVFCYSLFLWIETFFRKKNIKILRKKYPDGFIYNGEIYLRSSSKIKNLPLLNTCEIALFESIGISNFADGYYTKIDVTDYEYTCFFDER